MAYVDFIKDVWRLCVMKRRGLSYKLSIFYNIGALQNWVHNKDGQAAEKLNLEITVFVEMSQKPITREFFPRKNGALNEERLVQEDVQTHENQVKSLRSRCRNYAPSQLAKPRRRWTKELHLWFLIAIENLGGAFVATPKRIKHLMGVSDLTYNEIQSHLQQHRMHIRRG